MDLYFKKDGYYYDFSDDIINIGGWGYNFVEIAFDFINETLVDAGYYNHSVKPLDDELDDDDECRFRVIFERSPDDIFDEVVIAHFLKD